MIRLWDDRKVSEPARLLKLAVEREVVILRRWSAVVFLGTRHPNL